MREWREWREVESHWKEWVEGRSRGSSWWATNSQYMGSYDWMTR